jgi:4-hydroxy-2-oxoglutarate aldolase
VLGGFTDVLLPSTFAKGHGLITGLANIAPVSPIRICGCVRRRLSDDHHVQYAINKLFQLAEDSTKDTSFLQEAQRMQGIVARADYTIAKSSIAGTKLLLEKMHGYGGVPRKPLPHLDDHAAEALWNHPDTAALIRLEREVSRKGL